jgi:hypothetical protein
MDNDLNELLESACDERELDELLVDQLAQHVPDDERVGINTGWIGYAPPGAIYPDVHHRLPQLTRPVDDGKLVATLGRHGGVRVTNRIGDVVASGVWINGTYKPDESPADS